MNELMISTNSLVVLFHVPTNSRVLLQAYIQFV